MKRVIDIERWNRKEQYYRFRAMDYPFFNLCANLNISKFLVYIKENDLNFFRSMVFVSSLVANLIPEFRYRIEGDNVVEHDVVHPSFTYLSTEDVFSYCDVVFYEDYGKFIDGVDKKIESVKGKVEIDDELGRTDYLFMTSIPWVSFTSLVHPVNLSSSDCVPRISWGKFFKQGDDVLLPFSVQANHSMMDGVHMGRYFEKIQKVMDNPGDFLK